MIIILWIILGMIWLVFFAFNFILSPILSDAKDNIKIINQELLWTIDRYKVEWKYEIWDYEKISYIPIYNKKGELYAELAPEEYTSNKEYDINSNEIRSLLYIEDRGFLFRDLTFSVKGLTRAIYNIHFKGIRQWGSWITQQLVKNIILEDNTSSIARKYKELIISYYLHNEFSKIEIVNSYLNRISYWKNVYGIEQAWKLYLWKDTLKLEDAFLLNSMLKQPTYYYKNQEELKQRAKYYLEEYLIENGISKDRVEVSLDYIDKTELQFQNHNKLYGSNAYIRDKVLIARQKNTFDEIHLNYDISLQDESNLTEKIQIEEDRICVEYNICDIWIVVLSNSWSVSYLYWWKYERSQVDATSSLFELWSTLKPFIYANYFGIFWIKYSLPNSKICISDYCPQNWDKSFSKSVWFNRAINFSYNLPIIHIVKSYIKLWDLDTLFTDLWLYKEKSTPEELNYSMVLWTKPSTLFQLTNAYTSLVWWNFKKIGLLNQETEESTKFEKEIVEYIWENLKSNGLSNLYSIKTWTTSDFKDHYLMAYNNEYVIGIWMWNKDGSKTKKDIYSITKWSWIFTILQEYLAK